MVAVIQLYIVEHWQTIL